MLDRVVRWAAAARALGLSIKPLAGDSSAFERHHVSGHFASRRRRESRRARRRRMAGKKRNPAKALKALPKLGITASAYSHLILSMWCGTGNGSDSPHFEKILFDAWRRVPHRSFTAVFDAGYDSEPHHKLARHEMGLRSIMPPLIGRPTEKPPTYWRRRMKRLLATKASRRRCGYTQRWQVETVISMIKRNLGSALRGKSAHSRYRDLRLKVLTHNIMIFKRGSRQSRMSLLIGLVNSSKPEAIQQLAADAGEPSSSRPKRRVRRQYPIASGINRTSKREPESRSGKEARLPAGQDGDAGGTRVRC